MDQITLQILRVQKYVARATETKTSLANRAGLPLSTLIGMEKNDWNPRSVTLIALVRAVDKAEADMAKKKVRESFRARAQAA